MANIQQTLQEIQTAVIERFPTFPCIEIGAFVLEVLHEMGEAQAYPFTVNVQVYNLALTQHLNRGEWFKSPEQYTEWQKRDGSFLAGIGLGKEDTEGLWAGHLVVIWPVEMNGQPRNFLIDMALPQLCVSEHGIDLSPLAMPVKPEFLSGDSNAAQAVNGSTVVYMAELANQRYTTSPAWLSKASRATAVKDLTDRLK